MSRKSGLLLLSTIISLIFFSQTSRADSPEMQELYKSAKTEGQVIWQYLGSANEVKDIAGAFKARYPDIKLTVFSYSAARLPTRIIGEAAANRLTLDVATARPYYLLPLLERDLVLKYDWTKVGLSPDDLLLDGTGVIMFENPPVWFRNTNLVSEADAPKTWEDLLNPKWKGFKITMRASSTPFVALFSPWKKDPQKTVDFMNRLKKQEIVAGNRNAVVMSRVAMGECAIGRTNIAYVFEALKEKAPIAICPVGPTSDFESVAFIPKGAPHLNAAKFFTAWLCGPEGQKEWAKIGFGRATPPNASLVARTLAKNGIKFDRISSKENIKEFEDVFGKIVVKSMGFQPEE